MPDADAKSKRKGMEREQLIFQHSESNELTESGRISADKLNQIAEKILVSLGNLLLFKEVLDLSHQILGKPVVCLLERLH